MRKALGCALLVSMALLPSIAFAQFEEGGALIDPVPAVEWLKRSTPTVLGSDLMGDQIDAHTGALSFEQTDVSLPGNSSLRVELTRRRTQGDFYHFSQTAYEFGDWQIVAPHIRVMTPQNTAWGPSRCTSTFSQSLPTLVESRIKLGNPQYKEVRNDEYASGVFLDVPGSGAQQLLEATAPLGQAAFPQTKYVTTNNWRVTCIASIGTANGGGEGFYAYSPTGDRYRFDRVVVRTAPALGSVDNIESVPDPFYSTPRRQTMVFATEVMDVNGNTVQYTYDTSGRLTRILANDGREITLVYNGTSGLVSKVRASPGTSAQREWTYTYGSSQVLQWESSYLTYANILKTVTLPDGRAWTLDVANMSVAPLKGSTCTQPDLPVVITHPDGTRGEFTLTERYVRISLNADMVKPLCYNDTPYRTDMPLPYVAHTESLSVSRKRLSGAGIPQSDWVYSYEQDLGNANSAGNGDQTNWTKVVDPSGAETTYFHKWTRVASGGRLVASELRSSAGGALVQSQTNGYVEESGFGSTFLPPTQEPGIRIRYLPGTTVTTRGTDTYTTVNSYNTDKASTGYSFGFPIQINQSSSVASGTRTEVRTYTHNTTKWVVGLTASITRNGKLFESATYDTNGRLATLSKFGSLFRTLTYHPAGTQGGMIASQTDALNRTYTLTNYKRGVPQTVTRPDNSSFSRVIDNNGWITSQTDPRGNVTGLSYDAGGRLTLIDPPGTWSNTVIAYSGLGAGMTQTLTHGPSRTTITYDRYLRPVLVRQEDTNGVAGSVYTRKTYDGLGRTVFESWPSASSNPLNGMQTSYDALSRVTQVAENVSPNATTTYAYLTGNCVRVTDAVGAQTTTCRSGYGSPEDGNPVSIAQPEGIATAMAYDIYGNLTAATQSGGGKSFTQNWTYDTKLRLCAFAAPETGKTLYAYDAADQLTAYAEGLTGTACATLPSDKVTLAYDTLGRPTTTNFPGTTPDIARTYDANGNPLTVNRNGVNWTYAYHPSADLPVSASLTLDGRTYSQTYAYNPEQVLSGYTLPSGKAVAHGLDGLGRVTGVTLDGATIASSMSYHPNGALAGMTYGNGQVFSQTQTVRQMPLRLRSVKASEVPLDLTYAYTARGQVGSIDDQSPANIDQTFTYDGTGRLTASTGPWGAGTFSYDALGNLVQRQVGSRIVGLSYNATSNRLTSHTDTAGLPRSLSYDARGNVTALGGLGFTYDASNQPVAAYGAVTGTYVYDGHKRRVKQVVSGETRYSVYDVSGGLVGVDQVGAGPTEYIRASGMTLARVAGASVTWLHPDHLGSAVAGTGTTGSVVWRESEQPFGEDWVSAAANDNQAGYTGHIEDAATGLVYMQARYYDPIIGRFLANDPVGFSPQRPDMFNRYAYAGNDPVNAVDLDGELAILAVPLVCAGGACEAAAAGVATGVAIGGTYLASQNPEFALSAILSLPGVVPLIGMLNSDNQNEGLNSGLPKGKDLDFDKVKEQLEPRGWSQDEVKDLVDKTDPTGVSVDNRKGKSDPATVYGPKEAHVVVNDKTGEVIQASDKTDSEWIPDDRIKWNDD